MAEDPRDVVYFGRTNFRGRDQLFGIRRRDRRQHMYVIGQTGTGKSAMIHNMIMQDIANGEGVCLVDPHGENVEGLLSKIPENRMDDVVYFNPADADFNIGFNVLELPDPKYKHLVASGLMGIFTKIWSGVWSARMEYIMNNAVLALLDTPGTTLLGITRILVDKEYRQKIIGNVKDPVVKAFWINEYEEWKDQFRNEAIAPIQNKVGQFLSTALVRNIVGQSKSTIDIPEIMNSGKIFLVNVSKGRIGEDNSALLGAMLITKIQLAAMERVRIPEAERLDFYLYVDEFQNFSTDSFANILSEARKYGLNLVLAHQYVGQLITDTSTKVRDAVFGNVGTMIVFRVGATDADFLEKEFEPEIGVQDMVNLPNYHIYLKLLSQGQRSRPFSATTLAPLKMKSSEDTEEKVIQNSRKRYARPRWAVEDEINMWSGMGQSAENEADCMNCGKHIKLPFTPIPGRPVYCPECYAKVKSGEVAPARVVPEGGAFQRKPSSRSVDELAGLGIEFKPRGASDEGSPHPVAKEESKEARPAVRREEYRPRPTLTQRLPPRNEQRRDVPRGPERAPRHSSIVRERPSAPPQAAPQKAPEQKSSLSLSELKPMEKKESKHVHDDSHVDELRAALGAALKKIKE